MVQQIAQVWTFTIGNPKKSCKIAAGQVEALLRELVAGRLSFLSVGQLDQ
jgi:hypothetical protein